MYNMVEGKCPNCGGIINYDMNVATAVCKYCNTQFYVRDVIHNHYIVSDRNTYSIDTDYEAAIILVKNGDYASAERLFEKIRDDFPADYRGYFGGCIIYTQNFSEEAAKNIANISVSAYWDKYLTNNFSSEELKKVIENLDMHKDDIIWPTNYLINMQNAISLSKINSVDNIFNGFREKCIKYHRIFFHNKLVEMNENLKIIQEEERMHHYYIIEQKKMCRYYSVLTMMTLLLGLLSMVYVIINAGVIPEEGNEKLFRYMFLTMLMMFGGTFWSNSKRKQYKRNIEK